MRIRQVWIVLGIGLSGVLVTGCGSMAQKSMSAIASPFRKIAGPVSRGTKSMTGAVKKAVTTPFKDGEATTARTQPTNDFAARVSTDDYAAVASGRSVTRAKPAEMQTAWKDAEPAGENKQPTARDQMPTEFRSAFEEEYHSLSSLEKRTYEKAMQYQAEIEEKKDLVDNYLAKHREVEERKKKLQTIMDLYRSNPDHFGRGENEAQLFGQKTPAQLLSRENERNEDVSACASGNWTKDAPYQPPVDDVVKTPNAAAGQRTPANRLAMPPGGKDEYGAKSAASDTSPAMGPPSAAMPAPHSVQASVLATDGHGVDATVIIGAGTRDGVKKGMLFLLSGSKGDKVVLVVDEAYLTYARAYPHPGYAKGTIRVSDRVVQIAQMPDQLNTD